MDFSYPDQVEKNSPEASSDSSLSSESPDTNDIFGEPSVHPRVGDEYQVEIPSVDSSGSFLTGLPIPVMWIRNKSKPIKSERAEYDDEIDANSTNGHVKDPNDEKWLVPGKKNESWSAFKADCFVLGLYMLGNYGKNLLQVTRFVESKGMGDILAYYYGVFYNSPEYRKWSEFRKMMKSRKRVNFFTGYRQQQLFSRLFPLISEEAKTKVSEASRAFAEGRSSLDEYIFTLKESVGILALVNAVGIGKGKDDLTTLIFDGPKNNQLLSHRPEVPSGKAWSTLTCAEIVKYLIGDFRLSKAKSNDLFWEAVWPRLLARGWHSEQPKGSNHLVFLFPGIKSFSRRKLIKGDHYLDSITDVLAKVSSKPDLLNLESDGWAPKVKSDDEKSSSDHERCCYLKPRVSVPKSVKTKFTVVDTSLANEDNPFKVWELRCLPIEGTKSRTLKKSKKTKPLVNSNVLPSENGFQSSSVSESLGVNQKSRTIKHQFSRRIKSGLYNCAGPIVKKRKLDPFVDDLNFVLSLPARSKNASVRIVGPKLTSEDVLATDIQTETGVQDNRSENENIDLNLPQVCFSDGKVKLEEEVMPSNQSFSHEKINYVYNEKQKHFDVEKSSNEVVQSDQHPIIQPCVKRHGTSKEIINSPEKMKSQAISDEVIQRHQKSVRYSVEQKYESSENILKPLEKIETRVSSVKNEFSEEIIGSSDIMKPEMSQMKVVKLDQPVRRQSSRSRPPTTKALEAIEMGFFNPVRTYKKRSPSVVQDEKPKRARKSPNKSPASSSDMGF